VGANDAQVLHLRAMLVGLGREGSTLCDVAGLVKALTSGELLMRVLTAVYSTTKPGRCGR
jgi:hypothetical protein